MEAPPPLPLSPLLNKEFNSGTGGWQTRGPVNISTVSNAGLSGRSALKVQAARSDEAAVFQEDIGGGGRKEYTDCSRSMISP